MTANLTDIIDHHRRTHYGVVNSVLADDIERAFVLIPRAETEPIHGEVDVSADLIDDTPAWEAHLHHMFADHVAEAVRDGLLPISRPTVTMSDLVTSWGSRTVRVEALGWRLPDQDPMDPV